MHPPPARGCPIDEIYDFSEYLDHLKQHLNQYTIFIAARDTPWGEPFTQELTLKLMSLGLKTNLYGRFRYPYAAVIDQGKIKFEKLNDPSHNVEWSGKIDALSVNIKSTGYLAPLIYAKIIIDKKDYAQNFRGLNFVIYDKTKHEVLDSVAFDTFSGNDFHRSSSSVKEIRKWHNAHPKVGLLRFNGLLFPQKNLTKIDRFIVENVPKQQCIYNLLDNPNLPLRQFFNTKEDILESITPPKSYHDAKGVRHFEDTHGRQVNTTMGHRITTDQPEEFTRTIYMVGGCTTFGTGASDHATTASWLQRLCNQKIPQERFIVQNYGYYLSGFDAKSMEHIQIINSLPIQNGDIIILDGEFPDDDIPLVDLSKVADEPHGYSGLFADKSHPNENGYHLIADKIFERLQELNFFSDLKEAPEPEKAAVENIPQDNIEALTGFKRQLKQLYDEKMSVGAIVMNCNPFTLGHLYLIEQAAKQCAHVIVFVVEEDLSVFPFKDRLMLVKEGTKNLQNVIVLPSGQFILSSLTFSEYFNKSELQDRIVDASTDVQLFAKEIAPCLHITKRFIGEEPFDTVTRQYNREMRKILPQYGIEAIQIPRMVQNGSSKAISASEVRQCIKNNDLQSVKTMVPDTTYDYIITHINEIKENL